MKLTKSKRLKEIQEDFSAIFPGLRIAFYKKEHTSKEGSPKSLEYPSELTLETIQPELKDGRVEVKPSQSVIQFEQQLEERFGLHVQVFRRSNELWLQTSATDQWTLETQNRKGLSSIQGVA